MGRDPIVKAFPRQFTKVARILGKDPAGFDEAEIAAENRGIIERLAGGFPNSERLLRSSEVDQQTGLQGMIGARAEFRSRRRG